MVKFKTVSCGLYRVKCRLNNGRLYIWHRQDDKCFWTADNDIAGYDDVIHAMELQCDEEFNAAVENLINELA